jgi:hypothetical protein
VRRARTATMQITIVCTECGRRHHLERAVDVAGPICIVCHDCELPLRAVLESPVAAVPSRLRSFIDPPWV